MRKLILALPILGFLFSCNPAHIKIPPGEISVSQTYDQLPGRKISATFTTLGALHFFIQPAVLDLSETRVYWETPFTQPKTGDTLIAVYPKPGTSPYKEIHFAFGRVHSKTTCINGYVQPDRDQGDNQVYKTHIALPVGDDALVRKADEIMDLTEELRKSFNKRAEDKQPLSEELVQKLNTILTKDALEFPISWAYKVVPAEPTSPGNAPSSIPTQ